MFDFCDLIAHASRTRNLCAGTIIGSGTVSNRQDLEQGTSIADGGVGYTCIAEIRTIETIRSGAPVTPFLRYGDSVRVEMRDDRGQSIFGSISQRVVAPAHRIHPASTGTCWSAQRLVLGSDAAGWRGVVRYGLPFDRVYALGAGQT